MYYIMFEWEKETSRMEGSRFKEGKEITDRAYRGWINKLSR